VNAASDMEDDIAVLRNQISRAQGVQPIEDEEAKRLLREAAGRAPRLAVLNQAVDEFDLRRLSS
jgi:hypothetical protein